MLVAGSCVIDSDKWIIMIIIGIIVIMIMMIIGSGSAVQDVSN